MIPSRPQCAIRVGVTGSRKISTDAERRVRAEVELFLATVKARTLAASADPQLKDVYKLEPDGATHPKLRLLSPLADGADRLVAQIAEELGYDLDVALPFARDEYATDFDSGSREAFDGLLGAGDATPYLAIDGGRGKDESRSYEAVGRVVARNCDLLIAIWDGQPAKGRGGTADIVRFAARFGPACWWIDAEGKNPSRLVLSSSDLREPERARQGASAQDAIEEFLKRSLLPPISHHRHTHGIIGRFVDFFGGLSHAPSDPLLAYLREKAPPRRWLWESHSRFIRAISGSQKQAGAESAEPASANDATFWALQYEPADRASVAYRDRYRSSYVLIFALATLAVICAVLSLAWPEGKLAATSLELLLLGAIMALVYLNQKHGWQSRWISYRLLAELCRKQECLALLGWSLPASDLRRIGASGSPAPWVGWYFNALLRAAPLAQGDLSGTRLALIRDQACEKLISGQVSYHEDRARISAKAGRWLARFGDIAFLATAAIVLVKLPLVWFGAWHEAVVVFGIAAAMLPALSAAFVGIRAYSELELLEQQSMRMAAAMTEAAERIEHLRIDRPLASQDLAAELFDLSSYMLQDVNGWADLFHLKLVEAG